MSKYLQLTSHDDLGFPPDTPHDHLLLLPPSLSPPPSSFSLSVSIILHQVLSSSSQEFLAISPALPRCFLLCLLYLCFLHLSSSLPTLKQDFSYTCTARKLHQCHSVLFTGAAVVVWIWGTQFQKIAYFPIFTNSYPLSSRVAIPWYSWIVQGKVLAFVPCCWPFRGWPL